jgi:large subunit ribosomal protein L29
MTSAAELRTKSEAELQQELEEAYEELFNLRFRLSTKQLENTSRVRVVRRNIARLKTILRERELWAE